MIDVTDPQTPERRLVLGPLLARFLAGERCDNELAVTDSCASERRMTLPPILSSWPPMMSRRPLMGTRGSGRTGRSLSWRTRRRFPLLLFPFPDVPLPGVF